MSKRPAPLIIVEPLEVEENLYKGYFPKERRNPLSSVEARADWVVDSLIMLTSGSRIFPSPSVDSLHKSLSTKYDGSPLST